MSLYSRRRFHHRPRRSRRLRLEPLEVRTMFSVMSPAPSDVADISVHDDVVGEVAPLSGAPEDVRGVAARAVDDIKGFKIINPESSSSYGGCYGGLAPTTSGISDVNVDEDAPNEVIDLYEAFDDAEEADEDLLYQVVENDNPDLFNSTDIDSYGGLVLDFVDDAYGTADITVRATDCGGQWVETTFTVDVAEVNDAPVISDFGGTEGWGDYWTFSGVVTDVDDDVEGMIVTFGGVLASYNVTATVDADGTFSLTDEFPGLQGGIVTAQTEDDEGLESNVAQYLIIVT